ncbi:DUF2726 domain-containing protein [Jeongeupia chitinilytica]|uniref:DUF2726 domain-containing protein n=1 Tax=Jeongeupia chitinilytica TaxID=1041641 RepID=A0ABQ3H0U5_9NEIS|nr:DUF2726 domain-containing protein [Jeongeupia chitinilytica]GHD60768.1 hypothetical protein GCM10007350_14310 [Jeongeupia chitinilytica]
MLGALAFAVLMVVVAAVLGTVMKKNGAGKGASTGSSRFQRKPVLTEREQPVYFRLVEALSPDHIVLAQVSFSQLVVAKGGSQKENYAKFKRISQKSADFVVCKKDFSVLAVIELDDSTHNSKLDKDAERDAFLGEAGIKTLRFRQNPSVDQLRQALLIPRPQEAKPQAELSN